MATITLTHLRTIHAEAYTRIEQLLTSIGIDPNEARPATFERSRLDYLATLIASLHTEINVDPRDAGQFPNPMFIAGMAMVGSKLLGYVPFEPRDHDDVAPRREIEDEHQQALTVIRQYIQELDQDVRDVAAYFDDAIDSDDTFFDTLVAELRVSMARTFDSITHEALLTQAYDEYAEYRRLQTRIGL